MSHVTSSYRVSSKSFHTKSKALPLEKCIYLWDLETELSAPCMTTTTHVMYDGERRWREAEGKAGGRSIGKLSAKRVSSYC